MNGQQLQGPTCVHGYSVNHRGRHPNGRECNDWSDVGSLTVTPIEPVTGPERNVHSDHTHVHVIPTAGAIGRWSEPGVPSGRTYGTNAGKPVSRLASGKARLITSLMLLALIGAVALWVAFGGDGTPSPQPTPSAPPVSPGLRVGNGPYFG